ncbi:MAG TPA: hypothetical protein VF889_06915 [Bacteroidota bacterium]
MRTMTAALSALPGLAAISDSEDKSPQKDELTELRDIGQLANHTPVLKKIDASSPEPEPKDVPAQFALSEAFPNPFKPSTCVGLALPVGAYVRFIISDLLGHTVKVVTQAYYEAGYHNLTWDARSTGNVPVSSGLYYAHLVVTDGFGKSLYSKTNKLLLMK